jgi:predicted nucleic acid-binding protein
MSRSVVIDSSVVVKLFVEEDLSERAHEILARLVTNEFPDSLEAYAPDLMWVECANVLWKYVSFHSYGRDSAEADLHNLFQLAITPVANSEALVKDAVNLANSYNVAIYDALYLALAQHLNGVFLTADQKLVARVGERLPAVYLGDWIF